MSKTAPTAGLRLALLFIALFALAVPWYWSDREWLVWGIPAWFVSAIVFSALVSLVAVMALTKPWPGETDDSKHDDNY